MTTPVDVQNVPDVWGILERAREVLHWHKRDYDVLRDIDAALAQRDRFVLVPREPNSEMINAAMGSMESPSDDPFQIVFRNAYRAMLAAAPKPEGKP